MMTLCDKNGTTISFIVRAGGLRVTLGSTDTINSAEDAAAG
jgi:hypothetical protein